jgi:hypothetical protein
MLRFKLSRQYAQEALSTTKLDGKHGVDTAEERDPNVKANQTKTVE